MALLGQHLAGFGQDLDLHLGGRKGHPQFQPVVRQIHLRFVDLNLRRGRG